MLASGQTGMYAAIILSLMRESTIIIFYARSSDTPNSFVQ